MPRRGLKYAAVDVDLAKWCTDYMEKYRLNQADMARRLQVDRARITQMLQGQLNTEFYLKKAVELAEGGSWLSMVKYATSEELVRLLELQDARAHLTPEERELWDRAILELERHAKQGTIEVAYEALRDMDSKLEK